MSPTVSLLIPVFNEEKTLEFVLGRAIALERVQQCIVVNDGSADGTDAVLKKILERGDKKLRIVTHHQNRGKGAAIRSGLSIASSDFVVIQDADKEYDVADLDRIFDILERGEADVVYGSRFLKSNPNIYKTYLAGNKIMTAVINSLGGGHLTDAYTGYKGMSTSRWRALELESDGFEIEAEITIKVLRAGWKIVEVPITYAPRPFSEGKKIRGSDAVKGVLKALRCRLSSFHPGSRL